MPSDESLTGAMRQGLSKQWSERLPMPAPEAMTLEQRHTAEQLIAGPRKGVYGPLASSAWLLAVIGACDLAGTIGSGWMSERYDNRWLLAWYYGLRGLALLWLVLYEVSMLGLSIFAVIYGFDFIATVPPSVKLAVQAFGPENGSGSLRMDLRGPPVGSGLACTG